jgi:HEAT repeat protein
MSVLQGVTFNTRRNPPEARMKRFVLTSIIAIVAGAGPALHAQEKPVPRYEGKTLDYWIEKLQKAEKTEDRLDAANVIKRFGEDATPAVPKFVEMLNDHSGEFRELIVGIFRALGPTARSAVPSLVKSLEEKKACDPYHVIRVLAAIGPDAKDAVAVLIPFLEDPALCSTAAEAIGEIGPAAKSAIPALREAIKNGLNRREPPADLLAKEIVAMGKIGPDGVPTLKELLEREDFPDSLKILTIKALESIGAPGKDAVAPLTRLLKSNDLELRVAAARALWSIDKHKDALPTLVAVLREIASGARSPAPIDRNQLNEIREVMREVEAAREVMRYLEKVKPPVKEALAEARKYLEYQDTSVRQAAADLIFTIDPVEGRKISVDRSNAPMPAMPRPIGQ